MSPVKQYLGHCLQSLVGWLDGREVKRTELNSARRFLCLQYATALGTVVHATPVFAALRQAIPDARITVACRGLPQEVLKYNPHIDALIATPHPARNPGRALLYFLIRMRDQRDLHDMVVVDSGHMSTRYALLACLSGVRLRIGFRNVCDLYHASCSYDPGRSVVANNLSLVGLLCQGYRTVEPSVYFSTAEARLIEILLRDQRITPDKPLVALQTQTSGGQPNQWFDDRFVVVAEQLHRRCDAQVLFVGTSGERERIEVLRRRLTIPSHSLAGQTDIPALAALLARCDLLVTLDTGTMHVGRSVGLPMVVIAPAQNSENEWLPLGDERFQVLLRKDIACAGCRKLFCETRECMAEISAPEVGAAAQRQLALFPPSIEAREARRANRCRGNYPL